MVQPEIRSVFSTGGNTRVGYSKAGDKLIVAGSHGVVRVYETEHDDVEPDTFDIVDEVSNIAVSGGDKFALASKIGEVELYSISGKKSLSKIVRSALPIRGVQFTHGDTKLIAAGDDDEVQIVDVNDITQIIKFKVEDQVHDISYNKTRDLVALSLSNGAIAFFSLSSEEPRLITSIKGEIPSLIYQDDDETTVDNFATGRVAWHPNGSLFAVPCENGSIKVFDSDENYGQVYSFVSLHKAPITALEWSADGSFLASADFDNRLIVWDPDSRQPELDEQLPNKIINLSWSPVSNGKLDLAAGSLKGDIFYFKEIVELKQKQNQRANTSVLDDLVADEEEGDQGSDGDEEDDINLFSERSNDGPDTGEDLRDFVDDDGFIDADDDADGYAIPRKRTADDDEDDLSSRPRKSAPKVSFGVPALRKVDFKPYSQGCTPYIGDRRYLTMNSVGYVSTVKQDTHNSITVSFFDTSEHREYHFDDLYGYDLAALNNDGILLGFSGKGKEASRVLYRPHNNVADSWEKIIPTKAKEILTSVSLSDTVVVVCSSAGYIRSFSLFGIAQSIYKSSPIIASATNSNYIFSVSLSNQTQLIYNLQDLEGRFLQRDLVLPVELGSSLNFFRGVFFSAYGDPVIVDNDGVVLVLSSWRNPLQARWVPVLDSDVRVRQVGGKGDLKVWPLGLQGDNLNCIIIRGSQYPTYPLALPSEMEIRIPMTQDTEEDVEDPEEEFLRAKTMGSLLGETLANDGESFENDEERLNEYAIAYDRALLKLFVKACSEEKSTHAWKLVQDLKEDKALVAGAKVAERVGLIALVNRINKLREQRMEAELLE
ncbi:unnamed protein product [Cyberlindnera jadinii]|uniref:Uncharacterized protein n=1 Tax=Cyberlindnera jadinii (strain ATCC 18201 / CBS 1600 / BCRC 20928 / JCM 3617 / NBRC 0987 / NRRL Y-1542) TaxID=983966 RepID=A0A0H5C9V4_CYBJN|nr:unnamed protein product [Cyberlindnera jadinii]